jgi:glycine/D-amino acid oxidase-like deaminating enzyme
MRSYDALVVEGGMAGLPLALRAARHGRVALVERELLGGTCLNRGCIPTRSWRSPLSPRAPRTNRQVGPAPLVLHLRTDPRVMPA